MTWTGQKTLPVRSKKLRGSARDRDCTLRLPGVCNFDSSTVVLAHSPIANGGTSTKGSDDHGAFACSACHAVIDSHQPRRGLSLDEIYECWIRGTQETRDIWRTEGLLTVEGAA